MFRSYAKKVFNSFYDLNNTKVIILGNQKSGTTAIAKLLAENTGQSILADTPLLWEPKLSKIMSGSLSLKELINRNKYYFSRQIVKEPNLTFLYNQLLSIYPKSVKYVFIIRDPRDNIRSLLNRVKIPGNLNNIKLESQHFTIHEKALFDKKVFNYSSNHYIEQLAERWVSCINVYLEAKEHFTLVKYEDFNQNKEAFIKTLSLALGFKEENDISSKIDIQYQPKGNQETTWLDFFGVENLDKINTICGKHLQTFAYPNR